MASASQEGKAILIFMPGAPEIARLVRLLESSSRLRQAGQGRCKVLPLHGALPSHAQVSLPASVFFSEDKCQKGIVQSTWSCNDSSIDLATRLHICTAVTVFCFPYVLFCILAFFSLLLLHGVFVHGS